MRGEQICVNEDFSRDRCHCEGVLGEEPSLVQKLFFVTEGSVAVEADLNTPPWAPHQARLTAVTFVRTTQGQTA